MKRDLFPTPVWHIEGTPQELVDELYQGAYRFKEQYQSTSISNEGGYQSPMFDWESFHPVGREYIENKVKIDKGPLIKKDFRVKEWWYNINGKGHWNLPHTHPKCDLALVWYLTDSDGLLYLMNPFPQRLLEDGLYMPIPAIKGDIIIFPSDIIHFVKPNPRDVDRICISMNLQLCGN